MKASAIVMMLVGIFLLYGGLAYCIGIAWYHGQNKNNQNDNSI
ncbi:MAG: MetS family NSS transporter small subunit [Nitrospinae bacterium]|nr:MetS family NSS transporter small subunit [Nitrospinota bacterium]